MSSATFLNIYDRSTKRKTAILDNAYSITETQELNQIYTLTFSIPSSDPKTKYIQPFHYVKYGEDGQLYRITKRTESESDIGTLNVECEHVIATLIDTIMFGQVTYGGQNVSTAATIRWLLQKQNVINWELGTCDFDRRFQYGWEQENLLNALYSIPKEFSQPYYWDFDTSSMTGKWKVSLRLLDSSVHPEYYIRAKQNLLQQGSEQDNTAVCTKLYPLGYGEGVNQLTIKGVKVDKKGNLSTSGTPYPNPYLLASNAAIEKYGIIEKVLVDRRFEVPENLYAYGQSVLSALSEPAYSRSFMVTDLYPITGQEINNAKVGKICKLTGDGTITYITKTIRVLDDPGNLQIELSTKATDVASQMADLAERVRIESVYAQGATQLYQHSKDANATPEKGMIMSLYFPAEMVQINKVLLRLKLGKFRAYSQATETQEEKTQTSSATEKKTYTSANAAKTSSTSSAGGGSSSTNAVAGNATISGSLSTQAAWSGDKTAAYTGATTVNASSGATGTPVGEGGSGTTSGPNGDDDDHTHTYDKGFTHTHSVGAITVSIPSLMISKDQFSHSHAITVPSGFGSHSHTVSFGPHSHTFSIPKHNHTVTIPAHDHKVVIPGHSHKITPGIFEMGGAKNFTIYVGGVEIGTIKGTSYNKDITSWLLDAQNQIPRNTWIEVDIRPDGLAYVQASVFVQGFVQSRGGGNY